jgi:glutamate/tyrosine decarboxylase-like PLP-dependent enzyme
VNLGLDPEAFRRLGYRVVDALAERYAGLPDAPVARVATRSEMEAMLREPPPEQGSDPEQVLELALDPVLAYGLRVDHPRFFAYVPLPGNPVAPLADALASGHSVFAGTWQAAPGAAMVELVTLDWLRDLFGLPSTTAGIFVSGGSMANLAGLAVALHAAGEAERSELMLYASDETHNSIERAARLLGVRLRSIPTDTELRLDADALAAAVADDRGAGRRPWCVVATAGTTGTGSVDPLPELRQCCDEERLWLHVDGAYGAPAAICRDAEELLSGLEGADSLIVDPHKWLFQTPELGCLLVRDGPLLPAAFSARAAYLRDAAAGADEVNFADRGIQLTRQFGALKLWFSMKVYGVAAFRQAIAHGLALAEHAQSILEDDPLWEVVTPARLGIVTFRLAGPAETADEHTAALVPALMADGHAVITSTQVRGRIALRLCTDNPRSTPEDVDATLARLRELAAR